jgi:hypothetical protein
VIIKQTCVCGAPALLYSELCLEWMCGPCVLADHNELMTQKAAEQSWPPGPAGHEFGPGSVVVAEPGGLLEQLLEVSPG